MESETTLPGRLRLIAKRETMTNEFEAKDHVCWQAADEIDRLHAAIQDALGYFQITHCHAALEKVHKDV